MQSTAAAAYSHTVKQERKNLLYSCRLECAAFGYPHSYWMQQKKICMVVEQMKFQHVFFLLQFIWFAITRNEKNSTYKHWNQHALWYDYEWEKKTCVVSDNNNDEVYIGYVFLYCVLLSHHNNSNNNHQSPSLILHISLFLSPAPLCICCVASAKPRSYKNKKKYSERQSVSYLNGNGSANRNKMLLFFVLKFYFIDEICGRERRKRKLHQVALRHYMCVIMSGNLFIFYFFIQFIYHTTVSIDLSHFV